LSNATCDDISYITHVITYQNIKYHDITWDIKIAYNIANNMA